MMQRRTAKECRYAKCETANVPGLGVDSAQQIIAEVGVQASTFPSAAELTSWVEPVPERMKAPNRTTAAAPRKGINICGGC